jgi:hypothetical protein
MGYVLDMATYLGCYSQNWSRMGGIFWNMELRIGYYGISYLCSFLLSVFNSSLP